ncbi:MULTISPECIES: LysR family transcriptional regulator [unclassified Sphingobium]|uniref:LysR family transcriptional regulator n=1 Tax=unclassified Sphingobium TaxID=2611147 RepID=UPI0007702DA8|nr:MULTISPECIES: LysR family transcriptional regulator [Sphingomonadaceae]AMK24104.1 LysR family transcriptional regulator [Sphingobium sp. TKS]NML89100.1 LysR family transcriptional regulator [Sphingobium sp. TB-6]
MQLRDFDVNLLVTMEAIWTNRNVSNAARTLNLAQSTVSAALNRLRQALDDELFTWSGSEMVPTPLAEQIMPDVSQLLNGVRAVITKSRGQIDTVERRLVIATADYVAALVGGPLLTRAAIEAPQLSFDFVEIRPQFLNRSTRPDIDLFVFPANALRVSGMERELLYRDTYVCIGAEDNDALYPGMSADEFLALRHVGYSALPRVSFNHETMLWDELGKAANLRLTMGNYLIFARIVAGSDAVAILPRRLATTLKGEWKLKWIEPPLPTPEIDISATWRPDQSKDIALTWLRQALVDIMAM